MFKNNRGNTLYWALGIAGAVVAAAGTGTYVLMARSKNKKTRQMAAQAKRIVRSAKKKVVAPVHAKHTNGHAKHTNHVTNGHAHAR